MSLLATHSIQISSESTVSLFFCLTMPSEVTTLILAHAYMYKSLSPLRKSFGKRTSPFPGVVSFVMLCLNSLSTSQGKLK